MGKISKEIIAEFLVTYSTIANRRSLMKHVPNQLVVSTMLPSNEIFCLQKSPNCHYYMMVNEERSACPDGVWAFVNHVDDPLNVYCIDEKNLRALYFGPHQFQKVGHTTMTRAIAPNRKLKYYKERIMIAGAAECEPSNPEAKLTYCRDVYLSGEIHFLNGQLQKWTAISGHYRLKENDISFNMLPYLKNMLPLAFFEGL